MDNFQKKFVERTTDLPSITTYNIFSILMLMTFGGILSQTYYFIVVFLSSSLSSQQKCLLIDFSLAIKEIYSVGKSCGITF